MEIQTIADCKYHCYGVQGSRNKEENELKVIFEEYLVADTLVVALSILWWWH